MLNKSQYDHLIRMYRGHAGSKPGDWVGKRTWEQLVKHLRDTSNPSSAAMVNRAKNGTLKAENHLPTMLRQTYKPPTAPGSKVLTKGLYEVK